MIYETKDVIYSVVYMHGGWYIGVGSRNIIEKTVIPGITGLFPTREAAETTLKAHADKHRWKEIEG